MLYPGSFFSPNSYFFERVIFGVLSLITIWPILSVDYFVTHDGAAHLYNADILIDLLFKKDFYIHFFELNHEPEPNLIGHVLLIGFRFFLNPIYAEKAIATICLLATVVSLRYLLKSFSNNYNWFYLSAFLLGYNYIFVLGFYNFILSISVLFFTLGWFLRNHQNVNKRNLVHFSLLSLCLYFSHIFSYMLFIVFLIVFLIFQLNKQNWILGFKKIEFALWSQLVPLVFAANYFLKKSSVQSEYWSFNEKFAYLYKLNSIVNFFPDVNDHQIWFIRLYFLLAGFAILVWAIMKKQIGKSQIILVAFLLVITALYFFMPNTSAGGGYISDRFALFILFFIIILLSTVILPEINKVVFGLIIMVFVTWGIKKNTDMYRTMDNEIKQLLECKKNIKEGAVVLPVVFQKNWLYGHVSNYLAVDKKMVLLENYEASQGYFPVLWKKEVLPIINLPLIFNQTTNLNFEGYYSQSGLKVNNVLLWDNVMQTENPEYKKMLDYLNAHYHLVFNNADNTIKLYELN